MDTVAFSIKSAYFCREIGMRSIGSYQHRRDDEVGEIFYMEGSEVAAARLVSQNSTLASLYRKRFTTTS